VPWGYCTAWALVTLPPRTVIRTWTGPHWVPATSPVKAAAEVARLALDVWLGLDVADPLCFDDRDVEVEPEDEGCCTTGLAETAALLVLV